MELHDRSDLIGRFDDYGDGCFNEFVKDYDSDSVIFYNP